MTQEEVVHVPKVITQTRVQQQQVEQTVEVPVPMTQEEVVHVPKVVTQTRDVDALLGQAMNRNTKAAHESGTGMQGSVCAVKCVINRFCGLA